MLHAAAAAVDRGRRDHRIITAAAMDSELIL